MIVPDVNLLLDAINKRAERNAAARVWLDRSLSGEEAVGFSWTVLVGFIRISTRPGVFATPLRPGTAFDIVQGWLERPNVLTLEPSPRHLSIVRGLLESIGTGGNLTTDAHLAALAIEHGGTIASRDHDFGRFRGVKWMDPLAD